MGGLSIIRSAPLADAPNEEIAMRHPCPPALFFLLLVLSLCLSRPATIRAGSAPPGSSAMAAHMAGEESIPPDILASTAVDTLERMIFRYETVHFSVDSSVLLPAGQRALDRKAAWLMTHPDATVIVEGHCDARGTSEYNMALGQRRAAAAQAYLIEQGIAPHRIQVVSWGKTRPYVPGNGENVWRRNRRAEFLPR